MNYLLFIGDLDKDDSNGKNARHRGKIHGVTERGNKIKSEFNSRYIYANAMKNIVIINRIPCRSCIIQFLSDAT